MSIAFAPSQFAVKPLAERFMTRVMDNLTGLFDDHEAIENQNNTARQDGVATGLFDLKPQDDTLKGQLRRVGEFLRRGDPRQAMDFALKILKNNPDIPGGLKGLLISHVASGLTALEHSGMQSDLQSYKRDFAPYLNPALVPALTPSAPILAFTM